MATKKDWLDRLNDLFALMVGTTFPKEAENCRQQIIRLLKKHDKKWGDISELLAARAAAASSQAASPSSGPIPPPPPGNLIDGADLFRCVRALFQMFLAMDTHQYTALTLWTMHTFVFRQFRFTPRLFLTSAIRGEGKSTVFDILEVLVPRPDRSDNTTGATVMRLAGTGPTFLLDEADNLDLLNDPVFRGVLNSGYRRDGETARTIKNQPAKFKLFAPMALAGIGLLPLPLMRRCIVIRMQRATPVEIQRLERFDEKNAKQREEFKTIYGALFHWMRDCCLNDPPIPKELTASQANNWRPLLSIADACGPEIGLIAREAAVALSRGLDEDLEVLLITDIRTMFDRQQAGQLFLEAHPVNSCEQIASKTLLANLIAEPHGLWSDWTGENKVQTPRPLTTGIMAVVVRKFGVRPTTLWPPGRTAETKSAKGYRRSDFESAWERYAAADGTSAQAHGIRQLRSL
jgi:hypothetical protein